MSSGGAPAAYMSKAGTALPGWGHRGHSRSLISTLYSPASTDTRLIPDSWGWEGTRGDERGVGVGDLYYERGPGGREGTSGDAAGKAVNRKIVGSSPSSGAISELESAPKRYSEA